MSFAILRPNELQRPGIDAEPTERYAVLQNVGYSSFFTRGVGGSSAVLARRHALYRLTVFVATRPEGVPDRLVRFASVDGSVSGAWVTWDHHVTGEAINLDAMPRVIDVDDIDGIGTTAADTDALASVVATAFGGELALPAEVRAVLRAASYRCDHLRADPSASPEADRLGAGLHAFVSRELAAEPGSFGRLCRVVADAIAEDRPLPWSEPGDRSDVARRLVGSGRRLGPVLVIDVQGISPPLDPANVYAVTAAPVVVFLSRHADGGRRYTVGVHPANASSPQSLEPALLALARAEFACGPPCRAAESGPTAENWGGRDNVFGSPWNFGSRLAPEEVGRIVAEALANGRGPMDSVK